MRAGWPCGDQEHKRDRSATLLALVLAVCACAACDRGPSDTAPGRDSEDGDGASLTVMSANIYLGGQKAPSLERIACYLALADVAFLQEVDEGEDTEDGVDAVRVLARESGLTHYRSEGQERQRGDSGLAILSRYPLEAAEVSELTSTRPPYDAILKAVVRLRGEPVTLINGFYRAGYDREGREARLRATEIVLELVRDAEGAVIFGGDLNATSERPGIPELAREMTDAYSVAPEGRYHCPEPWGRIDYVFFRGPLTVKDYRAPCWPLTARAMPEIEEAGCPLSGSTLSDHPFVRVELAFG